MMSRRWSELFQTRVAEENGLDREHMITSIVAKCFREALSWKTGDELAAGNGMQAKTDERYAHAEALDSMLTWTDRFGKAKCSRIRSSDLDAIFMVFRSW